FPLRKSKCRNKACHRSSRVWRARPSSRGSDACCCPDVTCQLVPGLLSATARQRRNEHDLDPLSGHSRFGAARSRSAMNRERLWVISELFYPEQTSTGYFLTKIATGLAARWDVHAVA